jgi:SAM-dependent methyltransferase
VPDSSCRWCGAALDAAAVRLGGRVRCARCGVATTDPWPDPAALEAAYSTWYRPASGRFSGPGDRLLARMRARLADRIDEIAPPGRVLDVGAGEGHLVRALEARGRSVRGLERGDEPLQELRGDWAGIVFWHSLEHLPDPAAALSHAAALLAPRGVLWVAVPNADSLQARAFGDRWFALDIPRHLFHLNAEALTRKLQDLGLHTERVSHWRGGQVLFGWVHGLVGLLPGRPDLYDAIRRPQARRSAVRARWLVLLAAAVLTPVAAVAALVEVLVRRGGTVYVEARRA